MVQHPAFLMTVNERWLDLVRSELTDRASLLLVWLINMADIRTGRVEPTSAAEIGRDLGWSTSSVLRCLDELREAGEIERFLPTGGRRDGWVLVVRFYAFLHPTRWLLRQRVIGERVGERTVDAEVAMLRREVRRRRDAEGRAQALGALDAGRETACRPGSMSTST